jgi:hypothetical protein
VSLYKFSPIETQEQFEAALGYVAENVGNLAVRLCGQRMPVPILKLFAHYNSEYQILEGFVKRHGQKAKVSSGNSFYVHVKSGLRVAGEPIELLGVRRPDPYRMQVGCGDYVVDDFQGFADKVIQAQPEYARPVENAHGLSMVELWHPDFDVLGYIIPQA